MQLVMEKDKESLGRRRFFFLLSPRSGVGKTTLFLNILKEMEEREKVFGVDLDVYNPRNLRNYIKRVFTLKDFESMGYKPWRISSRLLIAKKVVSEIDRIKGYVFFNLTPGLSEENIFLIKNLPGIVILVVKGTGRLGILARRLLKEMGIEGIRPDGLIEIYTERKRFQNLSRRYGMEYLGGIKYYKGLRAYYKEREEIYKEFLSVLENLVSML